MSAEITHLALLFDAPLQSWGFASRFQRRTTGLYPTKSAVMGMICAAMGLAKGSDEEKALLPSLADLRMSSISIPRGPKTPVRRLEDYHTVGGGYDKEIRPQSIPRKASGGPCDHPTESHRQYLMDARFGVILRGDRGLLERVAAALADPVWGVWFGRKACLPAAPVCRGLFNEHREAEGSLLGETPAEACTVVREIEGLVGATDSIPDQPVSFGDGTSSGPDKRQFAVRYIAIRDAGQS